ncbi:hypothetical protein BRAS3843_1730030 [Bradyrhizobium sp. STM 3843]|uniref:hypothetical protein n=1 Tax=Bradyrhizobium sp. STM 3843 TaxID=551947 RepID=UPI000240712F|nr:hypothetical protein [Bradyrhizobium sp. STM 3843]CCE06461.1 hypothetical protein BRAS3843_1730030 [Bradyrhizobium sp. STM 3843]
MTERYPMLPPAADMLRRLPDDSAEPAEGLSRRMALAGLAVLPIAPPACAALADPAFGLIAAKRAADAAHGVTIDAEDEAGYRYGCRSDEAIEAALQAEAAAHLVNRVAWRLARTQPTTLVGIAAVLRFANQIEDDGLEWPSTDTVGPAGWHYQLRATMAAALEAIIRRAA